ncbi:HAD-superfamily subfamily IB hydrolase, TIGR01490 [Kineococcus radiotolerans SRS30216 = ATCC BAA-149]|uniref:HAD-superfamily subfamily IB hydrolase, TIGR01490 n=1 Tax=Kineococcus radiotolerans (strain ATCC BAA-149 / DSM 14245 / SRS30216) TaxID=266940 RepID=A6W5L4_KINRD|nr:HAD-superfamily subfamily IB hydrolase, TIGR01490 [Kineococcus radiotolerans SRS30216 = ATCC BAA-149]
MPPAPPAVQAAFFDLDNTLVRGATLFYFARGLAARGFFSRRELQRFARRALRFAVRGEHLGHLVEARDLALAFVAGHETATIRQIGEEVYDEHVEARVSAGARELAHRHLAAGAAVWLVTAAPVEMADVVARRLGLTGALGTVAESEDGVYTGRLVGEPLHGQAKADAVRALAERDGFDLARCAAYSDSANDLPLLMMVGRPVVVNPDRALRRHAAARGWPVHEFRPWRHAVRWTARAGAAGVGAVAVVGLLRRR